MMNLLLMQGIVYPLLFFFGTCTYSQTNTLFKLNDCNSGTDINSFSLFNKNGDFLKSFVDSSEYNFLRKYINLQDTFMFEALGYPRQLIHINSLDSIYCLKPLEIVLQELQLINSFSPVEYLKDLIEVNTQKKVNFDTVYYDFEYNMVSLDGLGSESLKGVLTIAWNEYLNETWGNASYAKIKYSFDSIFINSSEYEKLVNNMIQPYINFIIVRNPKKLMKAVINKKSSVHIDSSQNNLKTLAFKYCPHDNIKVTYNLLFNRSDSLLNKVCVVLDKSDFMIRGLRRVNRINEIIYSTTYPMLLDTINIHEDYTDEEGKGVSINFKLMRITDEEKRSQYIKRKKLDVAIIPNYMHFFCNKDFYNNNSD